MIASKLLTFSLNKDETAIIFLKINLNDHRSTQKNYNHNNALLHLVKIMKGTANFLTGLFLPSYSAQILTHTDYLVLCYQSKSITAFRVGFTTHFLAFSLIHSFIIMTEARLSFALLFSNL